MARSLASFLLFEHLRPLREQRCFAVGSFGYARCGCPFIRVWARRHGDSIPTTICLIRLPIVRGRCTDLFNIRPLALHVDDNHILSFYRLSTVFLAE
jgi:hypothetical protein